MNILKQHRFVGYSLGSIAVVLACVFSFPLSTFAATLYVSPASGTYGVGEPFTVLVYVGGANDPINAASGQMSFDNDHLKISSVGFSNSIFKIWAEEPGFSNVAGTIHFSGGLPTPGFTGNAGGLFRVTFQPIKEGSATVSFLSGSVLANDGNGTDVMTGSSGATYTIVAAKEKPDQPQTPTKKPTIVVSTDERLTPPIITDWPEMLEEKEKLVVHGVGTPSAKLMVYFQKGSTEAIPQEITTDADGRFTATFGDYVKAGLYHISAKNISPTSGALSPSSDVVTTQVIVPYYIRIGKHLITYVSIIIGLISLLFIILILLFIFLFISRKWRDKRGIEISGAERALHKRFDEMRSDLHKSMKRLFQVKSYSEKDKQVEEAEQALEQEMDDVEKDLHQEIEDIKRK